MMSLSHGSMRSCRHDGDAALQGSASFLGGATAELFMTTCDHAFMIPCSHFWTEGSAAGTSPHSVKTQFMASTRADWIVRPPSSAARLKRTASFLVRRT